mmetsp:Transcript_36907/g.99341  ORF Transcript_36907/g.99341 Transcript_36907/m.99341 type:complete len:353 (+) Transcript_36907:143-1201(+)
MGMQVSSTSPCSVTQPPPAPTHDHQQHAIYPTSQQSYERAYNESNTKVCIVLRQNQGCTHPEWSHRPGEPVPLQLAGHISQEQWTKFLTEIDTEMPLPSPWIWLCAVGIAIGFFGTIIHPAFIAFWAISIPVLVIYLCHITREQQNFLNSLVVTYGETFRAVGVQLSNEMVVEGSGKNKREIKWIQLLVTTPQVRTYARSSLSSALPCISRSLAPLLPSLPHTVAFLPPEGRCDPKHHGERYSSGRLWPWCPHYCRHTDGAAGVGGGTSQRHGRLNLSDLGPCTGGAGSGACGDGNACRAHSTRRARRYGRGATDGHDPPGWLQLLESGFHDTEANARDSGRASGHYRRRCR